MGGCRRRSSRAAGALETVIAMASRSSSHVDRWATTLTSRFLRTELKAGRTPKEMASSVGCSENTVRDYLARHGLLELRGMPKSLRRDYGRLGSIHAVGELHEVSFSTARRWLLAAGVSLNDPHRPEGVTLDIARAAHRYEAGESLAAIAGDVGVGANTLKRRLQAHGVVMRPRGRPPRPQ
jgi:hypothetical protein